ncbi:MAG: type II secretion system F family protein [Nanoarchaeota archaeon]
MVYRILTRVLPKKVRSHYNNLFLYSKIEVDKEKFLGFFLLFSLLLSLALSFIIAFLFKFNLLITFIIILIIIQLAFYFGLSLKADANAKFVETVLPDALQLMTSNLRAGLTTDRALILSARPEFGPLSYEINEAGKKITLGKDLGTALEEMAGHFKSTIFKKTIILIVSGLKSGGELTELLDQTSINLRREKLLEEKIKTNVLMYVIFIFIAIGFGAPILFGLSSFLVEIMQTNLAQINVPETTSLPLSFSQVVIQPSFILTFVIVSLITTSILGSLVLGLIGKGSEKAGLRYIPILSSLTLTVFFITRFLISVMFSGIFNL